MKSYFTFDLNVKISTILKKVKSEKKKYFGFIVITQNSKFYGVLSISDLFNFALRYQENKSIKIKKIFNKKSKFITVNSSTIDSKEINHYLSSLDPPLPQYLPVVMKDKTVIDVIDVRNYLNKTNVKEKVTIIGSGFVGTTLACAISQKGYQTTCYDINKLLINKLRKNEEVYFEKNLKESLKPLIDKKKLFFTYESSKILADIYIVAVGTPILNKKIDISQISNAIETISTKLKKGDQIMLRSTVKVGVTENVIKKIIEKKTSLVCGEDFHLTFCPERTVEGNALEEIYELPQIIGGITNECTNKAKKFWSHISTSVISMDSTAEAEFIKLLNNSFRDLSFSFSNAFAILANKMNIDAEKVISSASLNYPREKIPKPSPGVGGYCLTKDPYIYSSLDYKSMASKLSTIGRDINVKASLLPLKIINKFNSKNYSRALNNILIIGIAFKGNPPTNDLRGSNGVFIARKLIEKGHTVRIIDNVVSNLSIKKANLKPFNKKEKLEFNNIIIMNNHEENYHVKYLDYFYKTKKVLLLDTWSGFNRAILSENIKYASLTKIY